MPKDLFTCRNYGQLYLIRVDDHSTPNTNIESEANALVDIIITYSSHPLITIRGANIKISLPIETIRTRPSVVHVTDQEGRLYFLPADECRTWFVRKHSLFSTHCRQISSSPN